MASLYKGVSRALKSAGWFFHHQGRGSHEVWRHEDDPDGVEIAVPAKIKKPYTAEAIMKAAGMPKGAFSLSQKELRGEKR